MRRSETAAKKIVSDELLNLFRKTGALLDGHFILRSGLSQSAIFSCAIFLQHTDIAARVCGMLADRLREIECDSVDFAGARRNHCRPGGRPLVRQTPYLCRERSGGLVLRRGFTISPNEKFIVAEDVVTRGGRVQQTIDIVHQHGGIVTGVGVIVDRSGGNKPDFGCPFVSLVQLEVENFEADNLPPDLVAMPAAKPGSK